MSFNCQLMYDYEFDINDWQNEYNKLYETFKEEYICGNLSFKEIPIKFKKEPKVNGRHNSFYHMTTGHDQPIQSDEERYPDTKRIKKFYYPKIMINNYTCTLACADCSGMKTWIKKERGVTKAYIYFDELKYIVILEYRKKKDGFEYFLFKTAYYVEYARAREIFLHDYSLYKNATLK